MAEQYPLLPREELLKLQKELTEEYKAFAARGLRLDMSRGNPSAAQLDSAAGLLDSLTSGDDCRDKQGNDVRNYGHLDGIQDAKELMAPLLGVEPDSVLVGGNSSLTLMYDTITRAYIHGVVGSQKPWGKYDPPKFLCPCPGYDRHFAITQFFGFEMIPIPMGSTGPDMDLVEKLAGEDEAVKGIWCVPKYSNPTGVTYSDETVRRLASMKTAARDFRIFWDNAYAVHHLYKEKERQDQLLNIMEECKKYGTQDRVFLFASTSKISMAGSGISAMAASPDNMKLILSQLSAASISYDKVNQLRHARYFGSYEGILARMEQVSDILRPKFELVLKTLDRELGGLGIGSWPSPRGGYFIAFDALPGCAKRIIGLCGEAGVKLTKAGAPFPYGKDPKDQTIRLAPSFPPLQELETAMELFCICVKLASVEKLLAQ